jgi:phosphate-selective porin OprO/OprP
MRSTVMMTGGVLAGFLSVVPGLSRAETIEQRLERLERTVEEQGRIIEQQQRELDARRATPASAAPAAAPPPAAAVAATPAPPSPDTMRAYWKEGLRFETADKNFQAHVGGRGQLDFASFTADDKLEDAVGTFEDGAAFRRARLMVEGLVYKQVEFRAEYEFAGGEPTFKDVYIGLIDLPYVGGIRVGHFKEPFSLEELGSDNFIPFMERALPNALAPSRNLGGMVHNTALQEWMTWAAGAFRDSDDFAISQGDGEWGGTARVTGLPWWQDDGRSLVHLGIAGSYRDPADDSVQFRSRPEARLAPDVVDTGAFDATSLSRLGAEFAAVQGPFWLQGEYIGALTGGDGPGRDANGYYVQAGFFLTGESRPYKRESGAFDRVRPRRPFLYGDEHGYGAWELLGRWSSLDLNSGAIRGGSVRDITAGVSWYLNPLTRVSANYVFSDQLQLGDAHAVMMRFWFDF